MLTIVRIAENKMPVTVVLDAHAFHDQAHAVDSELVRRNSFVARVRDLRVGIAFSALMVACNVSRPARAASRSRSTLTGHRSYPQSPSRACPYEGFETPTAANRVSAQRP